MIPIRLVCAAPADSKWPWKLEESTRHAAGSGLDYSVYVGLMGGEVRHNRKVH